MENKVLENAVDDISLIKNIIESTRKSFIGFSKIFIYWGILFGILSIIQWVQTMNMDATIAFYNDYQFLVFAIPIALIAVATIIYRSVVKKQPLIGLERHLMLLWILLLFIQAIPTRISISNMGGNMSTMVTTTNNFAIVAFALGIALIMTAVLTSLNIFKVIGSVYLVMALIYGYFPIGDMTTVLGGLGPVILPFTLLFTGVYLKKHHERSEVNGTQLNS
jgi:hypothetical protein